MTKEAFVARFHSVCEEINSLNPQARLLVVTKGRSEFDIRCLAEQGQRHFAESYWQEAADKIKSLSDLSLSWHFIGRLQSNKCEQIARHVDWVHSVSDIKHARLLALARSSEQKPLSICLQVNVTGESSKAGLLQKELLPVAKALSEWPQLQLRGLMTMLPRDYDEVDQHKAFTACGEWAKELQLSVGGDLSYLSMGMSQDYRQALGCGARWCRIGSRLFDK